jgi:hypothetical protein
MEDEYFIVDGLLFSLSCSNVWFACLRRRRRSFCFVLSLRVLLLVEILDFDVEVSGEKLDISSMPKVEKAFKKGGCVSGWNRSDEKSEGLVSEDEKCSMVVLLDTVLLNFGE